VWFPSLNTDLDFQTASRKKIVETVGVDRLVKRARDLFSPEFHDYEDSKEMCQAVVITDNWDAIMFLAADTFAMNEGFGITKDYSEGIYTTSDKTNIDYDNFNDYSNDADIVAEEGGKDEQEHWQIESRTIDVLNSMSALVRQGLHECYLLDADGNQVVSRWGIAERVNPREMTNSILRWTQGSLSLDDMISKLSDKQKANPWLSQLIKRLSDKSGNETDFQSQFYSVFTKDFQPYSIVLLEDGKYHNMPVNSHPALSDVMNTIITQFKTGNHALFDDGHINFKLLGSENTVGKEYKFNLHMALNDVSNAFNAFRTQGTLDEAQLKEVTASIMGACRIFGFNVTEDMVSEAINAENIRKMFTGLRYAVKKLDDAYKDMRSGKLKNYDPFKFGSDYGIDGNLKNLFSPITDKLEDVAVSAFYDSGKMYQSYVTPSFMTKLMKKFRLKGKEFNDFITKEYGSSEWFRVQGKADFYNPMAGGWRNVWLDQLVNMNGAREVFDHKVELNFNKHNYMRNMSDAEYTLSLITEYFSVSAQKGDDMAPSWYRIPMQSNKPSSEFIKFYSYRGTDYKKRIVNGLHLMFLQEISRIQTVRMRNLSKNDPDFIKNFDTNGRKFCFLPALNPYLENTEEAKKKRNVLRNEDNTVSADNERFAKLLQTKIAGEKALTRDEEVALGDLADKVIEQSMEDRVQDILAKWEKTGILEAAKKIQGIYPSEFDDTPLIKNEERDQVITEWTREQVENFLWNDSFASLVSTKIH